MSETVDDLQRVRKARSNWPPECIESERKFKQRVARLYPLIGVGGGVITPVGQATLVTAFDSACQVLPTRGRLEGSYQGGKMYRPLVEVGVEEIEPYTRRDAKSVRNARRQG